METEMSLPVTHKPSFNQWLVVLFMVACSVAAWWLTPHVTWFDHIGQPKFENIIPKQYGDWVESADAAGSLRCV